MTLPTAGREAAASPEEATSGRSRWPGRALHALAALVVLAGLLATALRPLAPDLGEPADPSRWFDPAYLALAQEYRGPRYAAAALALFLRVAVPCLVAFTPPGRRLVTGLVERLGARPVLAPVVVVLGVVALTDLLVLPVAFWVGYVHDGAYGLRTQGLAGWSRDWLVLTVPAWLLVCVLAAVGWSLARRFPRTWPAIGGLAASGLLIVLVGAGPVLLEPLQYRTEPLPPGAVRDAVEAVAARSEQSVDEIVVADASRRSVRQNAYVSGLGATRRIVLYDTLVEGQPPEGVAHVVAHELAHDQHGDLGRASLLGAAGLILAAYALDAVMRWRVRRGRQPTTTDPRAAAVVVAVAVLMIVASHPAQKWVGRQFEAAADLSALDLTEDPQTFLEQREASTRANLADPSPPAWARLLWSTHPSTVERLEMGERWPLEWRGPVRP